MIFLILVDRTKVKRFMDKVLGQNSDSGAESFDENGHGRN